MKRLVALALAAVVATGSLAVAPADAYTDSSLGKYIARIGSSEKSVTKGSDFELEVRKGTKVRENDIKWTIGNTSVVKFDDDDRYDDEIELRAVGAGTTKVTANNLITGGKIAYTITVKNSSKTISRVGDTYRSVSAGKEFELEVNKHGGIQDKDLYWYTSDRDIVRIDDDDRTDEEIELRAVSPGKATITCKNQITGGKIHYYVTVKDVGKWIERIGSSSKTVEVGDDLELEVRKSGLTESQIKWSIDDTNLLRFEDGENYGSEVELEARRTGTTKVRVKNMHTGGELVYTVKVVPDYDDEWDD